MKKFYAILCVIGFLVPYWKLVSWILENGFNISLFISKAFTSKVSAFAWFDVIISAAVLLPFIFIEGSRINMKGIWAPLLATCIVGVSLGLPLFLFMRERHFEKMEKNNSIKRKAFEN